MSASFNQVTLLGNCTRDPESRFTPQGTQVVDISLALNRQWKDDNGEKREEVTYVDIILWDRLANVAETYLRKGSQVLISGRLQQDTWVDKNTNQKRSRLRVVGENLRLLSPRGDNESALSPAGNQTPQRQAPAKSTPQRQTQRPAPQPEPAGGGYNDGPDEDTPFAANRA